MSYASESFTGTATGTKYIMAHSATVAVGAISDSWTGTVKVRWTDDNGVERYVTDDVGNDLELNANGMAVTVQFARPVKMRGDCTAYTTGTIKFSMSGSDYHTRG